MFSYLTVNIQVNSLGIKHFIAHHPNIVTKRNIVTNSIIVWYIGVHLTIPFE